MAAAGPPLWAGSAPVAESAGYLAPRYGAFISSRKRASNHPLSISNPGSDHNTANTTAYAVDMATFNGAPLAHAIARHFVIPGYSTGNYNGYAVARGGAVFRIQILWAVQGHYNHTHHGARLSSGSYSPKPTYAQREAKLLKPLPAHLRRMSKTLLYRRRRRKAEARTGQGPRWRKWDRAVTRSANKVERALRRAKKDDVRRVLRRVLDDRNGHL